MSIQSVLGSVILLNQQIQCLTGADINRFKQLLGEEIPTLQLAVNKCQYGSNIAKLLTSVHTTLTNSVLAKLAKDVKKIFIQGDYQIITKSHFSSLSILSLPSAVVQHIALFFETKLEAIAFGCVNRQCYIETQNLSFILNHNKLLARQSDRDHKIPNFSEKQLEKIINFDLIGFAHNLQHSIQLGDFNPDTLNTIIQDNHKHRCFRNLFYALNVIDIRNAKIMEYMPIEMLFDHKNDVFERNNLKLLRLYISYDDMQSVNTFADNYQKYFSNECNNDVNEIRKLDHLYVETEKERDLDLNKLFTSLQGNFEQLTLQTRGLMNIFSVDILSTIFHANLKHLTMFPNTVLMISDRIYRHRINRKHSKYRIKEIENNNNNSNQLDKKLCLYEIQNIVSSMFGQTNSQSKSSMNSNQLCELEKLKINVNDRQSFWFDTFWSILTYSNMVSSVKCLTIDSSDATHVANVFVHEHGIHSNMIAPHAANFGIKGFLEAALLGDVLPNMKKLRFILRNDTRFAYGGFDLNEKSGTKFICCCFLLSKLYQLKHMLNGNKHVHVHKQGLQQIEVQMPISKEYKQCKFPLDNELKDLYPDWFDDVKSGHNFQVETTKIVHIHSLGTSVEVETDLSANSLLAVWRLTVSLLKEMCMSPRFQTDIDDVKELDLVLHFKSHVHDQPK